MEDRALVIGEVALPASVHVLSLGSCVKLQDQMPVKMSHASMVELVKMMATMASNVPVTVYTRVSFVKLKRLAPVTLVLVNMAVNVLKIQLVAMPASVP